MDYKEFEYICLHMNISANKERTKLLFQFDVNSEHQRNIVEKYMNIKPDEFEKFWFPLREKQKIIRKQRLEKFKEIGPKELSKMPLEQKLLYIDAMTATKKSTEEWTAYFTPKVQDNLKACLFSMQPSKKFLLEEQRDLNHFMNVLIGSKCTLIDTKLDERIKEIRNRTPDQRKQDMHDFVHLFSQVYKVPESELIFADLENPKLLIFGDARSKDRCQYVIRMNEKLLQDSYAAWYLNFGKLFHELTHTRQKYWHDTQSENYPLFSRVFNTLNKLTSDDRFNYDIYELLPNEGHAHYLEQKFCEQCNDRLFECKLGQKGLTSQVTRTLWYDYQGR